MGDFFRRDVKSAVFQIRDLPNQLHYVVHEVEDFYDLQDNFLYSTVYFEDYTNNYLTGEAEKTSGVKELEEPLVNESLSEEETKDHIFQLVNKHLSSKQTENIRGLTYDDVEYILELRQTLELVLTT